MDLPELNRKIESLLAEYETTSGQRVESIDIDTLDISTLNDRRLLLSRTVNVRVETRVTYLPFTS